MEKQYTKDSLFEFIQENKKWFYKIIDINFVAFRAYIIDWKIYDSTSMNINVCKKNPVKKSDIPNDGVYSIIEPHAFMMNQYH